MPNAKRPYPGPPRWRPAGPALPPAGTPPRDDADRHVLAALARLPERTQHVAELRLRHQLTTSEIASTLGITPYAVERHLVRALRAVDPSARVR